MRTESSLPNDQANKKPSLPLVNPSAAPKNSDFRFFDSLSTTLDYKLTFKVEHYDYESKHKQDFKQRKAEPFLTLPSFLANLHYRFTV